MKPHPLDFDCSPWPGPMLTPREELGPGASRVCERSCKQRPFKMEQELPCQRNCLARLRPIPLGRVTCGWAKHCAPKNCLQR